MKKITLQMIADKLGVSKALVSKALANDSAVNEQTKETIWRTAEEMGYPLKRRASAGANTRTLAVLMPRAYLNDMEYWGKVIHGIDQELIGQGYGMVLSSIDIALPPKDCLPASVYENKVDGALVMGHLPDAYITVLRANDFPIVMVDANLLDQSLDHVHANNFLGAYRATQSLIEAGHRRIGFVGDADTSWSFRERSRGFEEAIAHYNAKHDDPIERLHISGVGVSGEGMYTDPELKEHFRNSLAEQRTTALFCANDLTAFESLKVLTDLGYRCPDDISIIGFDDLTLSELMQPKLTTVSVPKHEIGARAAQLIVRRIQQPDATPEQVLLATRLIERASVRTV